ncbi:hypothetical protein EIP86_011327 [Pleurotus ostreatoroseus]|nr:hypothetical protein EIP86_011327 [Pleurotus ostreatoroseus]
MAPVKNGRLIFNEIPTGYPEPGKATVYDDLQTIDLERAPLNGGLLVKTLVLSIDPYLRGRMRDPKISSYQPAFTLGQPIANFGVGVVLRSESTAVKAGDHVYGILPFQEYTVFPKFDGLRIIANEEGIPWSVYVGVAGMPGQTAYYGWKEFADPQKGDVVFVSGGAGRLHMTIYSSHDTQHEPHVGPVGATVVQIAKAEGLKVIASAGSEEKVAFLKSIGADVAFNYKTQNTAEILAKEGPINIYWDNVGGSTLDAALNGAARGARFIECGMITAYNGNPQPVNSLFQIIGKQLKVFGLLVTVLSPKYNDWFYETVPKVIADGKIKYTEDITNGLQYAGHALYDVQVGRNKGKSVIVVAQE